MNNVLGLRFVRNVQSDGSHPAVVLAHDGAELLWIAGCRNDLMARFQSGFRKCSAETSRTSGYEPNFRYGRLHTSIVAGRHGDPGLIIGYRHVGSSAWPTPH